MIVFFRGISIRKEIRKKWVLVSIYSFKKKSPKSPSLTETFFKWFLWGVILRVSVSFSVYVDSNERTISSLNRWLWTKEKKKKDRQWQYYNSGNRAGCVFSPCITRVIRLVSRLRNTILFYLYFFIRSTLTSRMLCNNNVEIPTIVSKNNVYGNNPSSVGRGMTSTATLHFHRSDIRPSVTQ